MIIPAITVALVLLTATSVRLAWLAGPTAAARGRLGRPAANEPQVRSWSRPPRWFAARAGLDEAVAERVWPAIVTITAAFLVGSTLLFGVAGLVGAGAVIAAGPWLLVRRCAARAAQRRARALPVLLEDVARALRSGASLRQALQLSVERADATLVPALREVSDALAHGGRLDAALARWLEQQPSEGLRLAVAALLLGIDAGGAHGRALDGVAASLRDRLAVDREVAALSSQARASAVVMAAAPVVFAVFAAAADRRTAHFLVGTAAGLTCLTVGLALDAMAAWWMVRVTGAVR